MVFPWILIDSKSPQVSRTLLSILDDLNNAVVWMISFGPLIYKSSSPCTSLLVTVSSARNITGITVTFIFQSLMSSMYIRWYIFSCDLWSMYQPVHFLSKWLSDIIVLTNSNGDSPSLWKIPLWIFTSVKLFPSAVSSAF